MGISKRHHSKKRGRPRNVDDTLSTILGETEKPSQDAVVVSTLEFPQDNEGLKAKYEEMHSQGPSAWFSDGQNERELILAMGDPWAGRHVLEIGCGEGDLTSMIWQAGGGCTGIDYSMEAIRKAHEKFPESTDILLWMPYKAMEGKFQRIAMQGVIEHLNEPFVELRWVIQNLLLPGGDVITSSPGFINPRGFVWMVLNMIGAVM